MKLNSEVKTKSQIWWDLWWLGIAKHYSTGSKDPSTKVGAVVVHKKRLVSAGYNGFPEGYDDNPDLYWDREYKLENCIHAEINAISTIPEKVINKAVLYVYPFMPCKDCAMKIAEDSRISRIVTTDYSPERWLESFKLSKQIISDSKIQYLEYPITQVL